MRDLYLTDVPHDQTLSLGRWTVRFIQTSERYGAEGCLTAKAPMVEFYNSHYQHTPLGSFTAGRYLLSPLIDGTRGAMMLSMAHTVCASDMDAIRHWLLRLPLHVTV